MDKSTVTSLYCIYGLVQHIKNQEFVDKLDEEEYMVCSEVLQDSINIVRNYTGTHPDIVAFKNEMETLISTLKRFNPHIV